MLAFIAMILAVVLVYLFLPSVNQFKSAGSSFSFIHKLEIFTFLYRVLLSWVLYPAFILRLIYHRFCP